MKLLSETRARRAEVVRLYGDPAIGVIHPMGGVGVPHDGCRCKNCREARPAEICGELQDGA